MNYKNITKTLLLSCMILVTISCNSTKKVANSNQKSSPYKFNFEQDPLLNTVLEKAKAQHKLVFVDMSASWCAPCQLMKRDVYTHQETADFFNSNYITYLVDTEKDEGPDLKLIFGVTSYPTLLILDGRGRELLRKEGGTFHEALVNFGKEGLAKNPKM